MTSWRRPQPVLPQLAAELGADQTALRSQAGLDQLSISGQEYVTALVSPPACSTPWPRYGIQPAP